MSPVIRSLACSTSSRATDNLVGSRTSVRRAISDPPVAAAWCGGRRRLRGGEGTVLRGPSSNHSLKSLHLVRCEAAKEANTQPEVGNLTMGKQSSGDAKLAVVTTAGCPHCKRAKKALREAGLAFLEYNLEGQLDVLGQLKKATGKTTVPQVFLDGHLLGGADDVVAALEDGTLQKKVEASTSSPLPQSLQQLLKSAEDGEVTRQEVQAFLPPGFEQQEYDRLKGIAAAMHGDNTHLPKKALTSSVLFVFRKASQPDCFSGADAVSWMISHGNGVASTREQAAQLGSQMVRAKLLRAVEASGRLEQDFQDSSNAYFQLTTSAMKPKLGKPLNTHISWDEQGRPAPEVAEDLRGLIVALYDKFLSSDGLGVDYDSMSKDPLFEQYINASAELQKVSLDLLTRDERMAFFINIYNAIIVHGTALYGAPANSKERLTWFSSLKYNIGGQDYSADDIEHGVLRGNKPSPASLWVLLRQPGLASPHFKEGDPRAKQAVTPMDPRIHFALVCGAKSCPPIRVYKPDSVDEGLEAAASAFCEGSVIVDKPKNSVEMSMILKWYGGDFGDSMSDRLAKIADYLPPQTATDLREMLASGPPEVNFAPYDWSVNKK